MLGHDMIDTVFVQCECTVRILDERDLLTRSETVLFAFRPLLLIFQARACSLHPWTISISK